MLASSFPLIDIHVKNGVPVTNRHVISVIEHDAEHIVLNVPILSVLAHLGWNFISDKTNCYLHGIVLSILATDTAIALPNLRQLEAWISSAAATRSPRSISSSFHTSDVRAQGMSFTLGRQLYSRPARARKFDSPPPFSGTGSILRSNPLIRHRLIVRAILAKPPSDHPQHPGKLLPFPCCARQKPPCQGP
jgi:hypothetical protein